MSGIKGRRRHRGVSRAEDMHLGPTAEGEDAHNRMRAVSEEDARAKCIVDIAWLADKIYCQLIALAYPGGNPPTSTSSSTVSTNRSSSEFRHPTITPGDEDRGRSYGQNTRSSPSLMSMLSSSRRISERASTAQLFARRDAEMHVARVLKSSQKRQHIISSQILVLLSFVSHWNWSRGWSTG